MLTKDRLLNGPRILLSREYGLFALVYFILALINLRVKLLLTRAWFDGSLVENHNRLLTFTYTNNEQSRLLQFSIPEFFQNVFGLDIPDAYLLQRWLFVFLAFLCFHIYLRKWFSPLASFAGVVFLAAIMPLSYFNHLQESAPLLLLTFLLGLWALRAHRDGLFAGVLLVGALNNETILVLTGAYAIYHFSSFKGREFFKLCWKTALVSIPAWSAVGFMRYLTQENPHLGNPWMLWKNVTSILRELTNSPIDWYATMHLYIFFIFGAFWVYAILDYRFQERFLRRMLWLVPLFIIPHLLTGIITEVRQMLPLSIIIIPMGLHYLERVTREV